MRSFYAPGPLADGDSKHSSRVDTVGAASRSLTRATLVPLVVPLGHARIKAGSFSSNLIETDAFTTLGPTSEYNRVLS